MVDAAVLEVHRIPAAQGGGGGGDMSTLDPSTAMVASIKLSLIPNVTKAKQKNKLSFFSFLFALLNHP
jgi:hypothetical protein